MAHDAPQDRVDEHIGNGDRTNELIKAVPAPDYNVLAGLFHDHRSTPCSIALFALAARQVNARRANGATEVFATEPVLEDRQIV